LDKPKIWHGRWDKHMAHLWWVENATGSYLLNTSTGHYWKERSSYQNLTDYERVTSQKEIVEFTTHWLQARDGYVESERIR
jgi:hypothetical protein